MLDLSLHPIDGNRDLLGESPGYDAREQRLLRTDMMGHAVRELRWEGSGWSAGRSWDVGELAAAVVPRAAGGLVVLTRTEVIALSDDGSPSRVSRLPNEEGGVRFNDAKCDPAGRLLGGWIAEQLDRAGGVLRIDPDGSVETLLDDVHLANGMAWSPDGGTYYLVDSATLTVDAFDYADGRLHGRRTIARLDPGEGAPNGLSVDNSGNLWIAITYGGQVRCYSPDGKLIEVLSTPARRVTSCAFAGPAGDEIFVTSGSYKAPAHVPTRVGLDAAVVDEANQEPLAGALFVGRPGVSGPPAVAFAG